MLLTAREVERTADWTLPVAYFAFWTVRLGGWLPRFDRCAKCGKEFGDQVAYAAGWADGLFCESCRASGMRFIGVEARKLAETFAGVGLDKLSEVGTGNHAAQELREAALNWIEHHTEKKLGTRRMLETT
jgi:hypothetical protein